MENHEIEVAVEMNGTEKLIKNIDRVIDASCDRICDLLDSDRGTPSKMIDALANLVMARASIQGDYLFSSNE